MKRSIGMFAFTILLVSCSTTGHKHVEFSNAESNYQLHLSDLAGINSNGYKHCFGGIDIQGSFQTTKRNLDLSIQGTGFFQYYNPENEQVYFSRNGKLMINREGYLINDDGYFLEPKIKIWRAIENIKIDQSGICSFTEYDTNIKKTIKILTYDRKDNDYVKVGNYYIFNSFELNETDKIISGTLELRNYNILKKLTQMQELLFYFQDINKNTDYSFKIQLIKELREKYKEIIKEYRLGKYGAFGDIDIYNAYNDIFIEETLIDVEFL
ncbi:MAG: hypothetical protein B6229_07160 [Spirochaetaceae bacterium 4572_7]|nr:MAG: hypothetical protein B6229_07160 [Spirochaetaceae bacterium 4572_7]